MLLRLQLITLAVLLHTERKKSMETINHHRERSAATSLRLPSSSFLSSSLWLPTGKNCGDQQQESKTLFPTHHHTTNDWLQSRVLLLLLLPPATGRLRFIPSSVPTPALIDLKYIISHFLSLFRIDLPRSLLIASLLQQICSSSSSFSCGARSKCLA